MELSQEVSAHTLKPFPVRLILKVVGYSSSAWYEKRESVAKSKPGPKPAIDDDRAIAQIRAQITGSKFSGEGYIKVKRKMAKQGCKVSKHRVNKLMRENGLLSPNRPVANGRKRKHDGRIITDAPNEMWATDGKKFFAGVDGWCWFFGVIEHFNDEIISWHTAKKGNRFAALEPIRAAVRKQFGSTEKGICSGTSLRLRSDHGSQYDSADFMNEMAFLGLNMSKAFVRSPECNGIIERFHRTLEEQVFQVSTFESLEQANEAIRIFINDYNHDWVLHRLNYCSPVEYREKHEKDAA
jgi:transposase InsO family protein